GVEVIALHRRDGFRPEIGRRIARLAAERRIDLLHCHQYSPFVYGRIATAWRRNLKLVYTEHGRLSDAPPTWKRRMVNPLLARLDTVKDFGTLLEAFAAVRRRLPGARLLIVGDGPERAWMTQRAAQPDLDGAVDLLGYRDDVRGVIAAADVYVNSSISEGISITILEAMAAGLPVVATAVGGTPEVLTGDAGGVLVPSRD